MLDNDPPRYLGVESLDAIGRHLGSLEESRQDIVACVEDFSSRNSIATCVGDVNKYEGIQVAEYS